MVFSLGVARQGVAFENATLPDFKSDMDIFNSLFLKQRAKLRFV